MPLATGSTANNKEIFFTERYKTMVRSEKELLLKNATLIPLVERNIVFAYRNDFYRLLRHYKIDSHLYWTIAYLNDITDPAQDITHLNGFYQIDESVIFKALSRSNTVRG